MRSPSLSPCISLIAGARGAVTESLVAEGSTWSYRADGSNQGTAWRSPSFNDSGWATGAAELGYGDGDETTVIPSGPSGAHYTTAYFRHTFSLSNVGELTSLDLEIVRDDGAVVYLNGTEIVRTVMPSGSINYLTRATSTIAGNAEDAWNGFAVDPASLVEGTNVIAVEIHQKHPVPRTPA